MNKPEIIKIPMDYNYKGSSNVNLILKTVGDNVDLITDFGERITSIQTGYGLMRVLENLTRNVYA